MIVLNNLNSYLGGGEVLLVRFATYLKKRNIAFLILCSENSYIENECKKNDFQYVCWYPNEQTCHYLQEKDKPSLEKTLNQLKKNINGPIRIFNFCSRDLHNCLYIFKKYFEIESISMGVYHPYEFKYLASFNLHKKKMLAWNRKLFENMYQKKSIFFMNKKGLEFLLGSDFILDGNEKFIPIPIKIDKRIQQDYATKKTSKTTKVICISRFANFKIQPVMHFVNTARKLSNIEFTLIGHGGWEIFIRAYKKIFNIKNLTIHNNIMPDSLGEIIASHDIGFAQGTSALEIAKFGKQVVIAPYSSLRDFLLNKKYYCGNFFSQESISLGDYDYKNSRFKSTLPEMIVAYNNESCPSEESLKNGLQNYESDFIFDEIHDFILNSNFMPDFYESIPKDSLILKKVIKNLFRLFK